MILLVEGHGLAERVDVGTQHKLENGKMVTEAELNWRDNPGWPGKQFAIFKVGLRKNLMFERDKPE